MNRAVFKNVFTDHKNITRVKLQSDQIYEQVLYFNYVLTFEGHGIYTEEQILALGTRPDVSLESLLFPELTEEGSSPSDHSTSSP